MPPDFMTRCRSVAGPFVRFAVTEAPAVPNEPVAAPMASPSWGLWTVCVVVGLALLMVWAGDRTKPLVLFPLLLGAAVGGWASAVGVWCDVPRQRVALVLIALGATALIPAIYLVAAQRQTSSAKPTHPLAERLIQQFEKQNPAAAENAIVSPWESYLQNRYGSAAMRPWLIGESVLAGMAATVATMCAWRTRGGVAQSV